MNDSSINDSRFVQVHIMLQMIPSREMIPSRIITSTVIIQSVKFQDQVRCLKCLLFEREHFLKINTYPALKYVMLIVMPHSQSYVQLTERSRISSIACVAEIGLGTFCELCYPLGFECSIDSVFNSR